MNTVPKRVITFGGGLYIGISTEQVRASGIRKGDYVKVTYTGRGWWIEPMELPNPMVLAAARKALNESALAARRAALPERTAPTE